MYLVRWFHVSLPLFLTWSRVNLWMPKRWTLRRVLGRSANCWQTRVVCFTGFLHLMLAIYHDLNRHFGFTSSNSFDFDCVIKLIVVQQWARTRIFSFWWCAMSQDRFPFGEFLQANAFTELWAKIVHKFVTNLNMEAIMSVFIETEHFNEITFVQTKILKRFLSRQPEHTKYKITNRKIHLKDTTSGTKTKWKLSTSLTRWGAPYSRSLCWIFALLAAANGKLYYEAQHFS